MGDRNNPIKFGPEWLRNLSREQATTRANNSATSPSSARPTGSQPGGSGSQVSGSLASSPPTRGVTQRPRGGGTTGGGMGRGTSTTGASGINTRNTNHYQVPRVLLASLRYGREEMLALYDRNSEAPDDLKHFDALYQPWGKPPAALNNYEDENRDRGGASGTGDRFTAGRGTTMRGGAKMRSPFTRAPAGRGMTVAGNPRMPYTGEEEPSTSRAWSAGNGAGVQRSPTEQTDWSKMFRRRQNTNTNWRQPTARDEEEWRQDSARALPRNNNEKWDREWGDRPTDRPQNWNPNRRRGGDEDNLPEWAVDNTEGGGAGTFDSTGAFHGCSNDDSSLPRTQDPPFELTRSHTHGSVASRKSSIDESSDEWWASEKAKKLSPKRFDTDMRFKRSLSANAGDPVPSTSKSNEEPEKHDCVKAEANSTTETVKEKYSDTQTFENPTKSDEREDFNESDEQLFTSVIITKNNSLRQKHQNRLKLSDIPRSTLNKIPIPPLDSSSSDTLDNLARNGELMSYLDSLNDLEQLTETSESTRNSTSNLAMIINSANNGMPMNNPSPIPAPMPAPMQNIGMSNSALNSSLGLPIGTGSNGMGMPMQRMPSAMQNTQLNNMANPIGSTMPSRSLLGGFHTNNGIPVIQNQPNATSSLFMNQNNPQQQMSSTTDPMKNVPQNPMYPMLGLQHSNSQVGFRSMYGNALPNIPSTPNPNNLAEQWFYEDPNKTIQGPFTSHDMYTWYRAGFFNASLMVRRGCDTHLRPLGSYGPIVPFASPAMNMMSQFGMSGFDARPPANEMLTPQPSLGIDVGRDTLWSQPPSSRDMLWMQQPVNNARNESSVNNLPVYFWDQQPTSAISSNTLLPEDIAKEMKTEDQILAQLRANQTIPTAQPFVTESPTPTSIITSDDFANAVKATPDLEELQKLIQNESLLAPPPEIEVKEKPKPISTTDVTKPPPQVQKTTETKQAKPTKPEADKATKNKENAATKTKNKKNKEDKKEDAVEVKKEEEKVEKRSAESSPSKSKKEEKPSKKELEREKKEWAKEGFTIVKGPEKSVIKENKKKLEDMRAQEEVERKKKEEERLAGEEEKKRRNMEAAKKPQEAQPKPIESLIKKAPWSATQAVSTNKDGLTLAEIQRLERGKKLEQMREQQQMMQIIAQQQAAAVAREQEMQAAVGWAKKKTTNNTPGQSLAEIQAETKRQAAAAAVAAAAAAAVAVEEVQVAAPPTTNQAPWANTHNGGFWDPQPNVAQPKQEKPAEPLKPAEPAKPKKKPAVVATNKKETTPAAEFETWCNNMLASWSYKIDVPTFIGFLKDIESPYEVKDYIKCYLDESKDSSDFARQFLERRSKLLRVGMVTPSDDLCSPAMAINPRNSASEYQEVKGKGKKTKKNKMLKVDARILGFSVTASQDRINVGDIDTV